MTALLLIVLSAVVVNYFAITHAPGLRPVIAEDDIDAAAAVACAVGSMIVVLAPLAYVLERVLLALQLGYLRVLLLLILIVISAAIAELVLRHTGRWLPIREPFMLLMVSNSTVLGLALFTMLRAGGLFDAVRLGVGTGLGFGVMLLTFSTLQQRLRHADVPVIWREAPIALLSAGLMALALLGLTGLVRE
jgi:Na+-translocating ferredoxin:NAD+ oxidoreductase subunit A